MKKHRKVLWSILIAGIALAAAGTALSEDPAAISPDGIKVVSFQVVVTNGTTAQVGETAKVYYVYVNTTSTPITFDANGMFVGCRLGSENRDFGHMNQNVMIKPGTSRKFSASVVLNAAGTWEFWPAYHVAGHYGPYKWLVKTITVTAAPPSPPPPPPPPPSAPRAKPQ